MLKRATISKMRLVQIINQNSIHSRSIFDSHHRIVNC